VLGETHHPTAAGRAPAPNWLAIPQRGLYTGVMVLGAVGTGKTSACMYPYVDQLLRWRADDPERKIGGLVLEVKGDFCTQVRTILKNAGRETDYVEVGLDSGFCYNPLHNDLDPYAVAYAIATLLNNLFGKSKEPFWQQAYTDLLKFVILLRRIAEAIELMADEAFAAIDEHPRYVRDGVERLQAHLRQFPQYATAVVTVADLAVTSKDAGQATAAQWALVQGLRDKLPDATVTLRMHRLSWKLDANAPALTVHGVLVTRKVGPFAFRREYVAPES
jgi:hypothetical protein